MLCQAPKEQTIWRVLRMLTLTGPAWHDTNLEKPDPLEARSAKGDCRLGDESVMTRPSNDEAPR